MRWGVTILTVALLIALVWASGCANVSFGSQKIGDFGNTKDELKAVEFFKEKYGDPLTTSGPPRFLEPVVSTGLVNKTPVDNITRLNKNADRIFFWVFYDNFQKGDSLTINWIYNGKTAVSVQNLASGKFGSAYGEFTKPDTGWPQGTHEITVEGKGIQTSTKFEIIDGTTEKGNPPFLNVRGLTWLNPQPEPPAPAKLAMVHQEITIEGSEIQCPTGSYACGNECSDLRFDKQNCGACNTPCPQGQTCQNGQCSVACINSLIYCNGYCRDLTADSSNCGSCGVACPTGQTCQNGQCISNCVSGQTFCNGFCRNLYTDSANCGSCGISCAAGSSCQNGICAGSSAPAQPSCASGTTLCNGFCRNLYTDSANCGSCGISCAAGSSCQNGICTAAPAQPSCLAGLTLCNGVCENLLSDYHNCGACGNKCPDMLPNAETECRNGICQPLCISGYGNCDGNPNNGCEVNLKTGNSNCGACGKICKSECHCADGYCISDSFAPKPPGYTCDAN